MPARDLHKSLVRVLKPDGKTAGMGFLLPGNRVATCFHVVSLALGQAQKKTENHPDDTEVVLQFPFISDDKLSGGIVHQIPYCRHPGRKLADIVILRLSSEPPAGATAIACGNVPNLIGIPITGFGYPGGCDTWGEGILKRTLPNGCLQVGSMPGDPNRFRPGFSGTLICDKDHKRALGMLLDADENHGTVAMVPIAVLLNLAAPPAERPRAAVVPKPPTLGPLWLVPESPPNFVKRPELLAELKPKLLSDLGKPLSVTAVGNVGVQGKGGIGKTVLAAALARQEDVRRQFPDGIFWITLGQAPNVQARQIELVGHVGADRSMCLDIPSTSAELVRTLENKACLLILDDVWSLDHVRPFLPLAGPWRRILVTTRNAAIVRDMGARGVSLDVLSLSQSRELLAKWSGTKPASLPHEAEEIIDECGRLPLALAMIGAMIRRRPEGWPSALERLQSADLDKIAAGFPDYPYPDMLKAMQVGLEGLTAGQRDRYLDFAAFREDALVPECVVIKLWHTVGLGEADAKDLLDVLVDRSLLRRQKGCYSLHDLQYDFVRKRAAQDLPQRHDRLLRALGERHLAADAGTRPEDDYYFRNAPYHLAEAGRKKDLRALLLDYRWIQAKLSATDVTAVLADYEPFGHDEPLQLLASAIRLSAGALGRDRRQLASQLHGRLLRHNRKRDIRAILDQARQWSPRPWLRPTRGSLLPAGGALLQILEGHADSVLSVAVTPDGTRAVSTSEDHTVKVWDLATGKELQTLMEHAEWVFSTAVTQDGTRAVSASVDNTLKVWDLATGNELRTLKGHAGGVNSVAVTPDGTRAVSASLDGTLKVWDLATGKELRTLKGHAGLITSVAVTPDGTRVVSASWDHTLKVWDLATGKVVAEFAADAMLFCAAVAPDGRTIVAGDSGGTVHILHLEEDAGTGRQ